MRAENESNLSWLVRDLAHAPVAGAASVPAVEFTSEGASVGPPPPTLSADTLLADRFEILELLGRGGMGEVYRARDRRLDRDVAIKILTDTDPDRRTRFEHEARAASAIRHEHVHAIYDVGTHDGLPFLVLELALGTTLRSHLAHGRLSPSRALAYGREIAEGLAAAHAAGVIHRDLKPENLVITRDDRVKIVDFGLAKITRKNLASEGLTIDGALLGTVAYMSPEQARGETLDHRSDLFALGAILVELLTGDSAFGKGSTSETLSAILRDDPRGLSDLPAEHARVLARCLAKQPAARFQSAIDLAFALGQLDPLDPPLVRAARPPRAGRAYAYLRIAAVVVAIAIVALGAIGVRALLRSSVPGQPEYTRLTFRRGSLQTARYAPDQRAVVYSGTWESDPPQIFTTQAGVFESRATGLVGELLAVSANGDLALKSTITRRSLWGFWTVGRLMRAPLNGGTPRDIADDISEADLAADGTFAAVRVTPTKWQLEWPLGRVVYETTGWIGQPRISPDGTQLAFISHPRPEDDGGGVLVIGGDGVAREVTTKFMLSIQGLAWDASGRTLLYAAAEHGSARQVRAASAAGGEERIVTRTPSTLRVLDVARDGRVLVARDDNRVHMIAIDPDGSERDLSWLDGSAITSFSGDDKLVGFTESWDGAGSAYGVYVRPFDGGPATRIGDGNHSTLSSKTNPTEVLLSIDPSELGGNRVLFRQPIGTGAPKKLDLGPVDVHWMRWFPDDSAILLVLGSRELARIAADGGPLEKLGILLDDIFHYTIAPDGKRVAAMVGGRVVMIDLATRRLDPIAGVTADERPIAFTADGATLYLFDPTHLPARLTMLQLATGARTSRTVSPKDRTGVSAITSLILSHDGTKSVFSYLRTLSTAYEVRDLSW